MNRVELGGSGGVYVNVYAVACAEEGVARGEYGLENDVSASV